jgi:hypothetical protein
MNNEMDKELQALLEASADVELNDYGKEVPDGTYPATIYAVEFTESKTSGNLMFKWEFVYGEDCEYANRHEWKYTVLNKPENMKRLTTDLEKFGIECTSIERIKEQLENLLDVPVDITIKSSESKSNGQIYRNISVNPQ